MSEEERRETTVAEAEEFEQVEAGERARESFSDRGELIKFGILVLVLLGTVLVVALSRPLIFGHIVPAIMGEGQEVDRPQPPVAEPVEEAPAYPATEAGIEEGDAYPSQDTFIPAVGSPGDAYPAPEHEGEETAVIRHIVQPNDNLTKIAEQYDVTIQEIIALNNITNPNRIEAGTVLQIPVIGDR